MKLPKVLGTGADHYARGREIGALLLWTAALFLTLALASYAGDGTPPPEGTAATTGANWVGPVGEAAARGLVSLLGIVAWIVPAEIALLGIPFVTNRRSTLTPARLGSDFAIAFLTAALVQVGWPAAKAFGNHDAAGAVGELFGEVSRSLFSTIGSFLVGFALLSLVCIGRSTFSFIALIRLFATLGSRSAATTARGAQSLADAWRKARELDAERREAERPRIELTPAIDAAVVRTPVRRSLPPPVEEPADDTSPLVFEGSPSPSAVVAVKREKKQAVAVVGASLRNSDPIADALADHDSVPASRAVAPAPVRAPAAALVEVAPAEVPVAAKRGRKPKVLGSGASPGRDAEVLGSGASPGRDGHVAEVVEAFVEPAIVVAPALASLAAPVVASSVASVAAASAPLVTLRPRTATPPPVVAFAPAFEDDAADGTDELDEEFGNESEEEEPVDDGYADDEPSPISIARVAPAAPAAAVAAVVPVVPVAAPLPLPGGRVLRAAEKPVASPVSSGASAGGRAMPPAPANPVIVDTTAALEVIPAASAVHSAHVESPPPVMVRMQKEFELPSIDFLSIQKADPSAMIDKEILFKNADLLIKTLADYGVSGKVEEILPGPTVTTYEVSPASGTKVSKVAGLADDLALALAKKVRIVAPIPGKNRIGFELPNEKRQPVSLRELVEDKRFQEYDVPLPVVVGRDIVGNPVFADLASMPHVIVAGATGAGKSVGLNVMLTSLLYRRTPDDLRMLMIDPKVVELAPFDRIPHMLLPVVTDMKQAANALKWAVDEMERRYQAFADAGTKNIGTYNGWVARVARGEAKNPNAKVVSTKDHNGFEEFVKDDVEGVAPLPEKLPYIVIVVDEFADLMMQQGKEVEAAVARLAQKARAAGMHVILATQRPSVDVITGMIKANFPTRIAFRVAQKVDSRTILDEQGAEHLLGRGDLLIRLNGTNDTRRVQCPWISEEEVDAVTNHLRKQGEPIYDENILKPRDEEGAVVEEDAEQDAMYDDALRIVADTRRCSTSWLQRKLGLGYNRAARIVEMMEKRGVVGPANGSKDREVLISAL
jgi:S-DNA-T family DNA segregation ATPase FtsK/SpoIIIE